MAQVIKVEKNNDINDKVAAGGIELAKMYFNKDGMKKKKKDESDDAETAAHRRMKKMSYVG